MRKKESRTGQKEKVDLQGFQVRLQLFLWGDLDLGWPFPGVPNETKVLDICTPCQLATGRGPPTREDVALRGVQSEDGENGPETPGN